MDETRIERALRQGPPFHTSYVPRPLALATEAVPTPGFGAMRLVALVALAALLIAASLAALTVGGFLRAPSRDLSTLPTANVPVDQWTEPASLAIGRRAHTATLLAGGGVLVVGGATTLNNHLTASTELYQPATRTWVAGPPTLGLPMRHTATLLLDGRVLVAGGSTLPAAEVFDPVTGSWSATSPTSDRFGHTATLLADGRVLVAGGAGPSGVTDPTELFDPGTGTWQPTGVMAQARGYHTATLLHDGRVLVVGGTEPSAAGVDLATAELYDPPSGTWSAAAALPRAFLGHTATLLPDGTVLVAGGWHSSDGRIERSSMIYDPTKDAWTPADDLLEARGGHTATLLSDGTVLVAGGFSNGSKECGNILSTAELYDPIDGTWRAAESMAGVRYSHLATPLLDGSVLVTGGTDTGCMRDPLASVELYGAAPPVK